MSKSRTRAGAKLDQIIAGTPRVPSGSKQARSLIRIGRVTNPLPPEVQAWNDAVEAKRQAKKANKCKS